MPKLNFSLEIETPEIMKDLFPEEGESEKDYKIPEKKKELEKFRKDFAKDVHKAVKSSIKPFLIEEFHEYLLNENDELNCEGLDSLEDYGIKIKLKEVK